MFYGVLDGESKMSVSNEIKCNSCVFRENCGIKILKYNNCDSYVEDKTKPKVKRK